VVDVDYLVVGAGAVGMAFADTLLTETGASIAIVDQYGIPGGHWTRAYPYIRLHQPSAFYGVNSRRLGSDSKDATGWNAGLFELASGAEVVAYYDQLMNQQFLPSGRVEYFPMSEYMADGTIVSLLSGKEHKVLATKLVDATYSQVMVPSMQPPDYEVEDGVLCVPPNALTTLDQLVSAYVIVGGGKTGIDTCLWLIATGVDTEDITWIVPHDSWLADRATIQPGSEYFEPNIGGFAKRMEACALATSIEDLFDRLETGGQLLRIDGKVRPSKYRCATVSVAEIEQLRRINNIIRLGRVRSIGLDKIVLEDGPIATSRNVLHIDCAVDGLKRRPPVTVFEGDRITLQPVRACQPVFSAAFIGHVEASYSDEQERNELCKVIPHPSSDIDWLRTTVADMLNLARWNADSQLRTWLESSRLDGYSQAGGGDPRDDAQLAVLEKIKEYTPKAPQNLQRLLTDIDRDSLYRRT
jgi:hypothetical protein